MSVRHKKFVDIQQTRDKIIEVVRLNDCQCYEISFCNLPII